MPDQNSGISGFRPTVYTAPGQRAQGGGNGQVIDAEYTVVDQTGPSVHADPGPTYTRPTAHGLMQEWHQGSFLDKALVVGCMFFPPAAIAAIPISIMAKKKHPGGGTPPSGAPATVTVSGYPSSQTQVPPRAQDPRQIAAEERPRLGGSGAPPPLGVPLPPPLPGPDQGGAAVNFLDNLRQGGSRWLSSRT